MKNALSDAGRAWHNSLVEAGNTGGGIYQFTE
jgi:hypothetical protein